MCSKFRLSRGLNCPILIHVAAHVTRSHTNIIEHRRGIRGGVRAPRSKHRHFVLLPTLTHGHFGALVTTRSAFATFSRTSPCGTCFSNPGGRLNVVAANVTFGCLSRGCPSNFRRPMLGVDRCPLPHGVIRGVIHRYGRVLMLRRKCPMIRRRLGNFLKVNVRIRNHLSKALRHSNRLAPSTINGTLNGQVRDCCTAPRIIRRHPPTLYRKYKRHSVCRTLGRILTKCGKTGIFNSVNYCALKTLPPFQTVSAYVSVKTSVAVTGKTSSTNICPTISIVNSSAFARSNVANLLSYIGRGAGVAVIVSSGRAATVANKRSSTKANHVRSVYTNVNISPTRVHIVIPLGGGCSRVGTVVHRRVRCGNMSILVPHHRYVRALAEGGGTDEG